MKTNFVFVKNIQFIGLIAILFINLSCNHSKTSQLPFNNDDIQKYLDGNVLSPEFGGKVFSAFKIFSSEEDNIYVWAFMQEFYKKDGKIEPGTAWSVPLVINIERINGNVTIKNFTAPRDGELYSEDIKKLFPKELQNNIFDFTSSLEMRELEKTSHDRAEKYYEN
jgi:hypothetical protein